MLAMSLARTRRAAETEVKYDLEVEGSSNSSEHETSDDEPGDAYANEPMADEEWLAQYWSVITTENNAFIWHFPAP